MRIWSLHPKYLDAKGLVALWRETLLAKKVLEGKTKGYKNHPQLNRFKDSKEPLASINFYLKEIYKEAVNRNYNFDPNKFSAKVRSSKLSVTRGQLEYEFTHLMRKLKTRDPSRYKMFKDRERISTHSLFRVVKGDIALWEVID